MKKKVLVITYHFPPRPSVASLRMGGLAKYLPEYGWEPTIITAKLPGTPDPRYHVTETEDCDILLEWKKRLGLSADKTFREQLGQTDKNDTIVDGLLHIAKEILAYPDYNKNWYKYVIPVARETLKTGEYNAILSSAGPYTSHIIAHELKKEFGIPWIADFRDLWTQNPYFSYGRTRNFFEKRLELSTLSNADVITTISPPLAKDLTSLHTKSAYSIPNGFDPELQNPGVPVSEKFTITYTGRLYREKRDPEPLFRTLRKLIDRKKIQPQDIEINFWGPFEPWVKNQITTYDLDMIVHLHDSIPRNDAIEEQWRSQILLLLSWNNPHEEGVMTGKLFEYLAARRPILSLGYPRGAIKKLLSETNTGIIPETDEDLEKFLLEAYIQYKTEGQVRYCGIGTKINQYNHREMAHSFSELLNRVAEKRCK